MCLELLEEKIVEMEVAARALSCSCSWMLVMVSSYVSLNPTWDDGAMAGRGDGGGCEDGAGGGSGGGGRGDGDGSGAGVRLQQLQLRHLRIALIEDAPVGTGMVVMEVGMEEGVEAEAGAGVARLLTAICIACSTAARSSQN